MKRMLAFLLAIMMVLGTPAAVLADSAEAEPIIELAEQEFAAQEEVAEEEDTEPLAEELSEELEENAEWVLEKSYTPNAAAFDNDRLLDGYVQKLLDEAVSGEDDSDLYGTAAGSRLSGDEIIFYNNLKTHIQDVASGKAFAVDFSMLDGWENDYGWTAAELGVDSIVKNGEITEEASRAIWNKLFEMVDFGNLFHCLLADCPYDFYWLDKTAKGAFGYGFGLSGNSSMIFISRFDFSFVVSSDFADGNGLVDNSRIADAQQAIANAQSLVAYHSINTDEAKLAAYAEEIMNLVSYNDDAAKDNSTPYGDPWQIIYVFDGDDNTNVVCEGYSKAFQYLCDLSSFNGDVTCHSVWGEMLVDGSGGGHMWNLIENENGRFLVDITNCDSGSIGAPDKLYMVYTEGTGSGWVHTFNIGGQEVAYAYDADMYDLICEGYPALYQKEITPVTSGSCGEDLTWELTSDGTLAISGSGDMYDYPSLATQYSSGAPWYQYREDITSLVLDDDITHIGNYAFTGLTKIEGLLDLPNSLVTIGTEAFGNCYSLSGGLYIPDGVTSIGKMAFSKCEGMNGSLVMPDGITTIDDYAFQFCGFTGTLDLPDALEYIGHSAFWMCKGFTGALTIPDGIVYISPYAFNTCTGLNEEVLMGENVAGIGDFAFAGSDNITGYRFVGVAPTEVGEDIFGTEAGFFVYYPEGAAGWTTPFWHGYVTRSYAVAVASGKCGDNLTWSLSSVGILRVEGSGAMYDYEFYNPYGSQTGNFAPWVNMLESITMIVLDDDITYIGDYAFYYCTEVEGGLTLPSSLTAIGDYAFGACYGLVGSLVIPEGVTTIGSYAFSGVGFPGTLTIPNTVTTIGDHAFMSCNFRGNLTIPDSVTSIGEYAFAWCEEFDGKLTLSKNLTLIPECAFYYCENLTGQLILPAGVTVIDEDAFRGCCSLTGQLVIPDGVTDIEAYAFYNCSGLSGDLTFPDSVEYIGSAAFSYCEGLDGKLTLSKNITRIMVSTFQGCQFTGDLVIPVGVSVVGRSAFAGQNFVNGTITVPGTVLSIGEYAFYNCGFVGDLTLPGVLSIDRYAFEGCDKLDGTVTFGIEMQVIKAGAFKDCNSVKKVIFLGNAPTQIVEATSEYSSFPSDWVLEFSAETEGWTVPHWNGYKTQMMGPPTEGPFSGNLYWKLDENGLLTISGTGRMNDPGSADAFPWYPHKDKITALEIEEGVTTIGWYAFHNYSSIDGEVIIPSTITYIGCYAFEGCTGVDAFVFSGAGPSMTNIQMAYQNSRIFPQYATLYYNKNVDYWKNFYWGDWPTSWCGYTAYPRVGVVASGSLGNNHEWKITDDGTLTIGGKGVMDDQPYASNYPWYDNLDGVTTLVIEEGVTGIPNSAFKGSNGLTSLELPASLTQIKPEAFKNTGLTGTVTLPANVAIVGAGAFEGCSGVTSFVFEGNAPDVARADSAQNPSFPANAVLTYKCGTTGWTAESWNGYQTVSTGHMERVLEAVPSTCTETGLTAGKFCLVCKTIFEQQEIVPALGHTEVTDNAVAPTCTATGLTEGKHCDTCGETTVAQEIIPANGHTEVIDNAVAPTCTASGLTEGKHCDICGEVTAPQEVIPANGHAYIGWFPAPEQEKDYHWGECEICGPVPEGLPHFDDNDDGLCDVCGYVMMFIPEIPEGPVVGEGEIALAKDYILLEMGEEFELSAVWLGDANLLEWSLTHDENGTPAVGYAPASEKSVMLIGTQRGTSWVTVSAETVNGVVKATCRIDVTDEDMSELTVHAGTTAVTTNVYSTNYSEIEVIFDLDWNMLSEESLSADTGSTIEKAYFADPAAAEVFMLHVKDDRTLAVIPTVDVTDASALKAVKSSYKSAIVVVADGEELITPEVVSVKVEKKLPAVKAAAVKFNSFYTGQTLPITFTGGEVVAVELGTNPKGEACPEWLILNDDKTVTLANGVAKASGKLFIDAYVEGYSQPVAVTVSVSAAVTAPKVKLSASKLTFNAIRTNASANQVSLISGDKKVAFEDLGITNVFMPEYNSMIAKDQKTYAAQQSYEVVDYNVETGVITINSAAPVKGKILLACEVEGSDNLISLPLSVEDYTKAPTIKLSASSITLNPNIQGAESDKTDNESVGGDVQLSLYEGLDNISGLYGFMEGDYCYIHYDWVNNNDIYLSLGTMESKYPFTEEEIEFAVAEYPSGWKEYLTIGTVPEDHVGFGFKINEITDGYSLILHVDQDFNVLGYSQYRFIVNSPNEENSVKKLSDWAAVDMIVTPADLKVSSEDVSWEIIDGKKNRADDQLGVEYANGKIVIATNVNTVPGMTYKVNLMLEGMAKPASLAVKTVAAAKSDIKLTIAAKGKLVTTDPGAEVVITPKWTNF
ncbi:MAG: leucine-rich repeat domain-containing protein, partial [Oscillospiraceae bacterium]|nr:leucine-rich repeat domain-containing protein [Oscillospiraceae bacterium]